MDKKDRRKANDHQMIAYFRSFDHTWRETKILSIKHIIENRNSFMNVIQKHYGDSYIEDPEHYTYIEATNGLIYSAISELMMYVEDLFCLVKFIRESEFFIKKTVQYQAGKVTGIVHRISKKSDDDILKTFMIPNRPYIESLMKGHDAQSITHALSNYDMDVKSMLDKLKNIVAKFIDLQFYYNQYKHGLSVGIKMYGQKVKPEYLELRKARTTGSPLIYDNATIQKKHELGRLSTSMIIPNISGLSGFISDLEKEGNLLTFQYGDEVDINELLNLAKDISSLMLCLIKNRIDFIEPAVPGANSIYFPITETREIKQVTLVPIDRPRIIFDYNIDI
ncbi:hypothetical protein NSQ20_25525 [Paenibacillus sp. FSL K6-1122]|uniref:hypothetical protein n=1 Tax=Paenibacillus sp. FSL K6-1122 TaxID=2954512 RepID=UPI0030EE07E9